MEEITRKIYFSCVAPSAQFSPRRSRFYLVSAASNMV